MSGQGKRANQAFGRPVNYPGQYEVRSWTGWHRHMTLALLALAALVLGAAKGGPTIPQPGRSARAPQCPRSPSPLDTLAA
jgi:hypothetical protein